MTAIRKSDCQTRVVIRRDWGRVVVHSHGEDEEPESIEIPRWAVDAIFAEAGKDQEQEARKLDAWIDRLERERRERGDAPLWKLLT